MARGKGRYTSAGTRDGSILSLTRALSFPLPRGHLQLPGFGFPSHLDQVEDGRVWHPDPEHGALTIGGRWARVVVHQRPIMARANTIFSPRSYPVGVQVPVGFKFETPLKVITCIRRRVRRSIMFATRRAGFGKRKRYPRRTWRSEIWC